MDTREMTREQISALADSELADQQVDFALAALRRADGKSDWDIYHRIGDVLRSDDMAFDMSPGFAARMAARLDAEPAIVAPLTSPGFPVTDRHVAAGGVQSGVGSRMGARRWAMPGMLAAAAMAAVAFVATPQLMVALKGDAESGTASSTAAMASAAPAVTVAASITDAAAGSIVTASAPEGVVLRDARIDDYLLAHQRFSPSLYSAAQYARSATFATDSNK
jgi:sigma-E factor negative regulatory protein RseA